MTRVELERAVAEAIMFVTSDDGSVEAEAAIRVCFDAAAKMMDEDEDCGELATLRLRAVINANGSDEL